MQSFKVLLDFASKFFSYKQLWA